MRDRDHALRDRRPVFPGSRLPADLIAERLAQCNPEMPNDEPHYPPWCVLCDETIWNGLDDHASTCPWRMAKELHPPMTPAPEERGKAGSLPSHPLVGAPPVSRPSPTSTTLSTRENL